MTTNNTQGLDEILDSYELRSAKGGVNLEDAKQAILQWVNDEVVDCVDDFDKTASMKQMAREQRAILKQHGWKEEK